MGTFKTVCDAAYNRGPQLADACAKLKFLFPLKINIYLNTCGYREHFAMPKKICFWSYLIINFQKQKNCLKKCSFSKMADQYQFKINIQPI